MKNRNVSLFRGFLIMLLIKTAAGDANEAREEHKGGRILSRRKRYLIFPEGSSLQLVYCLTVPSIGMGRIFTIGGTAALAWELPHNPYTAFRKPAEVLHRRVDKPGVSTSGGWTLQEAHAPAVDKYRKTYYRPFFSKNPHDTSNFHVENRYPSMQSSAAFRQHLRRMKPGPNYHTINERKRYQSSDRYKQRGSSYVHPDYHWVHRRTRRDLYAKIEKFFIAQSKDGKACLLKALCEVSQASAHTIGTFMEEIIKAIFRVKPHEHYEDEDEYDMAWNKNHNCTEKYSSCKSSVWNMF